MDSDLVSSPTGTEIFNFAVIRLKCCVNPLENIISTKIVCCDTCMVHIYRGHLEKKTVESSLPFRVKSRLISHAHTHTRIRTYLSRSSNVYT